MCLLPHHRYPLHHRIKALAFPTLHAQKVPRAIVLHLLAIIAFDRHNLAKLRRHGLQRNPHRHGVPRRLHPLVRLRRLLTHRTSRIVTRQLPKAMPMYRMPARQFVRCIPGGKQILLTHGTVGHVLSDLAIVIGE